ncbi:esterase/lipase family protein [Rubripirellula reticaptiva]|uniref:Alpha/beta hydrolase family protein n=1 Tax=Rubripirellula reticaptiva TaxID=2528013 RepID=A0A5C6EP56_9BACT|nr:hypothetical protein [Rubripirellula reticaptiva]TWU49411.1 hypothetical protein Poly59_40260 [Rubripirellula reticaptiva]
MGIDAATGSQASLQLPERVILIPGLLEPRPFLWPLQGSLARHGFRAECWRDRVVFRNLERSVDRLSAAIAGDANQDGSIGIVTHSFGDWVARAAIAKSRRHRVTAMVSLAPVMRAGFFPSLLYGVTWNLIPEIKIIMNRVDASANLDCDDRVRRLVVWSRFDESLRSVSLDHVRNLQVRRVFATHLTIVCQPNVLKLTRQFLLSGNQFSK